MRGRERLGRIGIVVTLVALCAVRGAMPASAQAVPQPPPAGQTPPAPAQAPAGPPATGQPAPAKPPAAPPTGLSFLGEAGLALFTVKSEGAADFEAFFAKVKEALEKSPKPEYKQMATGWKIYRVTDTLQAGQVLYASIMDPAAKGVDYDPVKILSDVSSTEITALYPKFKDALISVNRLNLQPVMMMKMGSL